MSAFTYYSPLWLGAVLAGVVLFNTQVTSGVWSVGRFAAVALVACPAAGLVCQLVTIGSQGVAARVVPVAGGRSIRGHSAVLTGVLILGAVAAGLVSVMFLSEQLHTPALVLGAVSGATGLGALAVYVWSLPAATRDFSKRES